MNLKETIDMKTRFTQLVKLRKQKAEKIEHNIIKILSAIKTIEVKISDTLQDIANVKKPKNGTFAEMNIATEKFHRLSGYKSELEAQRDSLENKLQELQKVYKQAMVEYEKIKHLEEKELEEAMKILKTKEQKELDEISTMLYANNRVAKEA